LNVIQLAEANQLDWFIVFYCFNNKSARIRLNCLIYASLFITTT